MSSPNSILLVEDTESHAALVIKVLSYQGYNIHWENTGTKAIEYFKQNQAALALIDIALPDISGEELIEKLRNIQNQHVPMIAITAHSMKETKGYLLDLGFDDYLSKPFSIQDLENKIKEYIPKNKF